MDSIYNLAMDKKARAQVQINLPNKDSKLKSLIKGDIVFVLAKNKIDFEKTIRKANNPYLLMRNFKYVYTPKMYTISYKGQTVKKRFDNKDLETDTKYIDITSLPYLKGYNAFVNTSIYSELLLSKKVSIRTLADLEHYIDIMLTDYDAEEINEYEGKVILLNVDEFDVAEFSDVRDFTNMSLQSMVLSILGKDFNFFKSREIHLVFSGANGVVAINTKDYDQKKVLAHLPNFIASLNKIKGDHSPTVKLIDSQSANEIVDKISTLTDTDMAHIKDPFSLDDKALQEIEDIKNASMGMNKKEVTPREEKYMKLKEKIMIKDGKSLQDILDKGLRDIIPTKQLNITSKDGSFKEDTFSEFSKHYLNNVKDFDEGKNMERLSRIKDNPLYVTYYKKEDVSTSLDLMENHKVKFLDKNGISHQISFNVPIMRDGEVYLNGTSKVLANQMISNPITKPKSSKVMIITDYNKAFCDRENGDKITPLVDMFIGGCKKALTDKIGKTKIRLGDATEVSNNIPVIFSGLSKEIFSLSQKNVFDINFSVSGMKDILKNDYDFVKYDNDKLIPFGILYGSNKNHKFLFMDVTTDDVIIIESEYKTKKFNMNIIKDERVDHYIMGILKEHDIALHDIIMKRTPGTRLSYSSITILGRTTPIGVILVYILGITELFEKASIHYRLVKKESPTARLPRRDKGNEGVIELKDYFIIYNMDSESALICNGINKMSLEGITLKDLSSDRSVLTSMISDYVGDARYYQGLDNFNDFMIDPRVEEWLEANKIGITFSDVLIYANTLLTDNVFVDESDLSNCRLRREEVITAIQYKAIATAYSKYNTARKNNSSMKMIMDKNEIINKLQELKTLKELAQVAPASMIEEKHSVSSKGFAGVNMDRAFTNLRVTHKKSYVGNIAMPTPFGPSAGIMRSLSLNPSIKSIRGHFKTADSDEALEATPGASTIGVTEALMPGICEFDSGQRVLMCLGQMKHRTPVKESVPLLVSYGFDESMGSSYDETYFANAKQDGVVISNDNDSIVVKYKDGTTDCMSLHNIQKNAEKSYYLTNRLTPLAVGTKFKKDTPVAYNENYYKKHVNGKVIYASTMMGLVAVTSDANTHEDSIAVSGRFSERSTRQFTGVSQSVFSPSTVIKDYIKKGTKVVVGDYLITFDELSESPDMMDYMTSLVGSKDALEQFNNQYIKSKYSGTIVDIKVYYTKPVAEYTNSMQDFIKKLKGTKKKKEDNLMKHAQDKHYALKQTDGDRVTVPYKGNINGALVTKGDGDILIEYYIEYDINTSIGDKMIIGNSALKGEIARVVPYDKDRPNTGLVTEDGEPVDVLFSWISSEARLVSSLKIAAIYNKALIGLGKKIKELL